jgi:hypothetical protein
VVPEYTTSTHRYVVTVKFTARRADRAVAMAESITVHCRCVAMDGYYQNGLDPPVVDHVILTAKLNYVAMVTLFPRHTVRVAVAQ